MTFDQTGTQPREQLPTPCAPPSTRGSPSSTPPTPTARATSSARRRRAQNERLVAGLLDELGVRDQVLLATKGGHVRTDGGGWDTDSSPEHLRAAVDASLRRLGVEQIALWQHHRPDPEVDYAEVLGHAEGDPRLRQGRMIGLSNADPDQIRQAHDVLGDALVSVQNQFSPAFRSSRPEIDVCEELGLAFLPWSPLGGLGDAKELAEQAPGLRRGRRGPRRQRPAGRARLGARPVAGGDPDPRRQAAAVDQRLGRRRRPRAEPGGGRGPRRRLSARAGRPLGWTGEQRRAGRPVEDPRLREGRHGPPGGVPARAVRPGPQLHPDRRGVAARAALAARRPAQPRPLGVDRERRLRRRRRRGRLLAARARRRRGPRRTSWGTRWAARWRWCWPCATPTSSTGSSWSTSRRPPARVRGSSSTCWTASRASTSPRSSAAATPTTCWPPRSTTSGCAGSCCRTCARPATGSAGRRTWRCCAASSR